MAENLDTPKATEAVAATLPTPTGSADEVDLKGEKYVPLKALHAEREEKKQLKERLASLEDKSKRWDSLEPILPAIAAQLELAEKTAKEKQQHESKPDPELVEFAEDMNFRDQEGNLDLKRAERVLTRLGTTTKGVVKEAVEPLRRTTVEQAAAALSQRAQAATFDDGEPVAAQEFIDEVLKVLPAELRADPNAMNFALIAAAGMEYLDQRKKGHRRTTEPSYTEAPGRRRPARKERTAMEEAVRESRGIPAEKWDKLSANESPTLE